MRDWIGWEIFLQQGERPCDTRARCTTRIPGGFGWAIFLQQGERRMLRKWQVFHHQLETVYWGSLSSHGLSSEAWNEEIVSGMDLLA
jgi:hypothetical protein